MRLYIGTYVECKDEYVKYSPFLTLLNETKLPKDKCNEALVISMELSLWNKYHSYLKGEAFQITNQEEANTFLFMGHTMPQWDNVSREQLWKGWSALLYMERNKVDKKAFLMDLAANHNILPYDLGTFSSPEDVYIISYLFGIYNSKYVYDMSQYKNTIRKIFVKYFVRILECYNFSSRSLPFGFQKIEGIEDCLSQCHLTTAKQLYDCVILYNDYLNKGILFMAQYCPSLYKELEQLPKEYLLYLCTEFHYEASESTTKLFKHLIAK